MLGRITVFINRVKVVCRRGLTVTRICVSDRNTHMLPISLYYVYTWTWIFGHHFFFFFLRGLKSILFVPFNIYRNYKDIFFSKYTLAIRILRFIVNVYARVGMYIIHTHSSREGRRRSPVVHLNYALVCYFRRVTFLYKLHPYSIPAIKIFFTQDKQNGSLFIKLSSSAFIRNGV